jgi:hypothetical protein
MTRKNRQPDAATGHDVVDEDSHEEEEDSYEEEESYEDEADDEEYDDDVDEEESSDEDDGYEDEDEEEVEVPETPAERRKRVLAARAAGEPTTAAVEPARSGPSTKWSIDRLDAREKRFSFVASGAAALFGIFIYVTETQNHNFRLAKGQLTPQTTLIIGLVAAALLVGVTVLGRRAPVGFVALFTGAAFGQTSLFLGVPFFVLAVWLLIRSYKVQKESSAKLRAAGGGARARPAPASRSAARPAAPARPARPTTVAEARRARSKKSSAPAGNKRYTPKRPAPPPPKPSRRQRKATASD